ncbi:MAG: 50S ribosomal protein L10 [Anaerolineales bacterium]|nr:50S ribosomal protein L10 [Anaerolineales bacterium]
MAISREKKEQLVSWYTDLFSRSNAVILTGYRGLTMADINQLRRKLQGAQSEYHVTQNRLLKLGLKEADLPVPEDLLKGPTATGFCFEEVPTAAKMLVEFSKESKFLVIKGGILGDRIISADEVISLAELPPREILLAQVLGTIQGPAGGITRAVAGSIRSVLYVLKARIEQLEKQTSQA